MKKTSQMALDRVVQKVAGKKNIFGAVFCVSKDNEDVDILSASGEFEEDSKYYIASINKLFISAIVLRLNYGGKLDLQDKISCYLPSELVKGLHVYKGQDYSNDLTIEHLVSLTSGLPCYLADKQPDGTTGMSELEAGKDQPWPIEKAIAVAKTMAPHFPPGATGKARYGDTNHQILSKIIENIEGDEINNVLANLFEELNMTNTYVCGGAKADNYVPIRYKSEVIQVPNFLNSTQNEIISNAKDQMIFLKAFFNGGFFPKDKLIGLKTWKNIFFPFKYGLGLQKFYLPWILSPFQPLPETIGHSGSTGSIAFYVPERQLYITGTVNQQAMPQVAFQTMMKIIST